MAYTPKTWQCDDTITADELNRMEQGIAEASQDGGGADSLLVVNDNDGTLDHTWKEIYDAYNSGKTVKVRQQGLGNAVFINDICAPSVSVNPPNATYKIDAYMTVADPTNETVNFTLTDPYTTDNENGYPATSGGGETT